MKDKNESSNRCLLVELEARRFSHSRRYHVVRILERLSLYLREAHSINDWRVVNETHLRDFIEQGIVKKACAIKGDIALRGAAEKAALQWKLKPGYGLVFARPKTEKNLQNFAQIFIVFDFKLDKGGAKRITGSQR